MASGWGLLACSERNLNFTKFNQNLQGNLISLDMNENSIKCFLNKINLKLVIQAQDAMFLNFLQGNYDCRGFIRLATVK